MDRAHFLRVLGADPERWAARWGLLPFRSPCLGCGRIMETTVPFAWRDYRGLIAPSCVCGEPNPPYCVVRDPKVGDLLEAIL